MPAWTGAGGCHLELRRRPRPARGLAGAGRSRTRTPSRPLSSGGRVPGALRRLERVGVVRHEHDRGVAMHAAAVVHELQVGPRPRSAPSTCAAVSSERARLGVAVGRLPNGVAVDPERHVVEEEAAVHLGHVDPALDAVGEGVERADQIAAVDADVEREMVAGARRERRRTEARARERLRPRPRASRRRRRRRARPRRPQPPGRRARRGVAGPQDDHVDAALARPLGEAGARPPCRHRTSG